MSSTNETSPTPPAVASWSVKVLEPVVVTDPVVGFDWVIVPPGPPGPPVSPVTVNV